MVRLGELDVGEVGEVARSFGLELLGRNREDAKSAKEGEGDAEVFFQRGCEQYKVGDFEAALASFDKVIEIQPDYY